MERPLHRRGLDRRTDVSQGPASATVRAIRYLEDQAVGIAHEELAHRRAAGGRPVRDPPAHRWVRRHGAPGGADPRRFQRAGRAGDTKVPHRDAETGQARRFSRGDRTDRQKLGTVANTVHGGAAVPRLDRESEQSLVESIDGMRYTVFVAHG